MINDNNIELAQNSIVDNRIVNDLRTSLNGWDVWHEMWQFPKYDYRVMRISKCPVTFTVCIQKRVYWMADSSN